MAITEIQSSSARADNADKAPTGAWDDTPTAGNLLICLIGWSESGGDSTVKLNGWTQVPTDGDVNKSGSVRLGLFYKTASGAESKKAKASLTASRRWTVEMVEVNNSSTPSGWAVDKSAHNSGSSTSPSSGTTLTTGTADEYWVAGFACQNQATLSSPTNGFATKEQQVPGSQGANYVSGALLTKIVTGTGTAASGGTYSKSRPWVGTVATFYNVISTVTAAATLTGTGSLTATPLYPTPTLVVQAAFGYGPGDPDPVWLDISSYVRSCQWQRGRQNELNQTQAGTATVVLNDPESHWDPNNYAVGFAPGVLADAPNGWWRLGETAGVFADSSGRSHSATGVGGITRGVPGAVRDGNGAVTLDGSTGYLTVPDHADFDVGDVFTLACSVKTTTYNASQALIAKGTNAYYLRLETSGGHLFPKLLKQNAANIIFGTGNYPEDGGWHRVAVTKNGAAAVLYLDGLAIPSTFTNATLANTSTNLYIGQNTGGSEFLNGSIDEVAVYPTALTAAQVLADYTNSIAGSPFYPYVKPGLPVRAILFVGSTAYRLFTCYAERLPRTTRVTDVYTQRQLELVDGFALLASAGLGGMSYASEASDVRVNNVLDDIGVSGPRRIGAGVSTLQEAVFPADDDTRAQTHLQAVNDSENGLFFYNGAGEPVFIGRRELISDPAYTVPAATFKDANS